MKCTRCLIFIKEDDLIDGACPVCNSTDRLEKSCSEDHPCTCLTELHSSLSFCPVCGEPACPECGSHDVTQISRVTGYLQEVNGWNEGKRQELKDRHRVSI